MTKQISEDVCVLRRQTIYVLPQMQSLLLISAGFVRGFRSFFKPVLLAHFSNIFNWQRLAFSGISKAGIHPLALMRACAVQF